MGQNEREENKRTGGGTRKALEEKDSHMEVCPPDCELCSEALDLLRKTAHW